MHAFRMTGEAKIRPTLEFIETLLDADAKFLLFAYHLSVLDAFERHLRLR